MVISKRTDINLHDYILISNKLFESHERISQYTILIETSCILNCNKKNLVAANMQKLGHLQLQPILCVMS